jgi:hypothetical protein
VKVHDDAQEVCDVGVTAIDDDELKVILRHIDLLARLTAHNGLQQAADRSLSERGAACWALS